jgi:CDP-glucose 4,6-dehydratase
MAVENPWRGRRVLLTGHTGFKGSWLCLWLAGQGAEVHGLSLDPPTEPNLFTVAQVAGVLASDCRADIRDFGAVQACFKAARPEVVFHLAAQSLVTDGYDFPLETYAVNVMGTAHVLEAARHCDSVRAVLVVTTDKCYENKEWLHPYRENDRLGGHDPYSSSKACAELVTSAFRASYFSSTAKGVRVASARAGNVIGGGDWAANRLIPDCIRAFRQAGTVRLRYPQAVRPWQHVLEPLAGYVALAERLLGPDGAGFARAWNFGPDAEDSRPVGHVAREVCERLGVALQLPTVAPALHEAGLLRLDSTLAKELLDWHPRWRLTQAIAETVEWYRLWAEGADMLAFSRNQIEAYRRDMNSGSAAGG